MLLGGLGLFVMSGMGYIGLLLMLGGMLSVLSWVGWRFFLAPTTDSAPRSDSVAEHRAGSALKARANLVLANCSRVVSGYLFRTCVSFLLVVLLVGGLGVGGVFSLSELISPDPLTALEMDRQAHIQSKLSPEHLVPPPALPPSMFIGSERLALETADRDWRKLDPLFVQSVLRVLSRLGERGYSFALLEGYRSPERQEKLADLGSGVTNARAFQSKHQFGRAVDLAPVNDGRLVISERDPWAMKAYEALGEEVEKAGLIWGGHWSFKDYGHVEMGGTTAELVDADGRIKK